MPHHADQSTPDLRSILRSPDWIWRGALTILLVANLWLQRTFLPREEYSSDRREFILTLEKLRTEMGELSLGVKLFEANRSMILDHEQRMRILEQRH